MEELSKRLQIDLQIGKSIEKDESTFKGISTSVETLQQVNEAYAKVRAMYSEARHVICAFRIPHGQHHLHEDYQDDNEHGAGRILLKRNVQIQDG